MVAGLISGSGKYFSQGLMMVIETGFIPLSPLSINLRKIMREAAGGLEKTLRGVLIKEGNHK